MSVLVSVVTPCYNHGQYLDDAIQSIPYDKVDYEIEHIIVNDGSTDEFTNKKISELNGPCIRVINQANAGLSAARNIGIDAAKGKYIIPLDADNKLHENYFTKAIDVLEKNDKIDIVYGNMLVFGKEEGNHIPGDFDIVTMLKSNYIDACAVIKRNVFDSVVCYDTAMLHGLEDWEFWIKAYFKGNIFYYLNDIGFYYRVTSGSMLKNITVPRAGEISEYVYRKHAKSIIEYFIKEVKELRKDSARYSYAKKHPVKTIVKLLLQREI